MTNRKNDKPEGYYQLLSPKQVAERLGTSRSMVYELINSGDLRSVPLGAKRKVRESDLRAYIDGLAVDASS